MEVQQLSTFHHVVEKILVNFWDQLMAMSVSLKPLFVILYPIP